MKDLMTTRELAELLGWREGTIHNRRWLGMSLPRCTKIGRSLYFTRADVVAWLEQMAEDTDEAAAS